MNTVAELGDRESSVYAPQKKKDRNHTNAGRVKCNMGVVIDINPVLDMRRKHNKKRELSISKKEILEEAKEFFVMATPFFIVAAGLFITYMIGK